METEAESAQDAISERVVELLNEAITCVKDDEKVKLLQQVQEFVINHDILDNFLDEVLGFQADKSANVRRFVVAFIEASCKKDPEFFSKLIINLHYAINDENANVVKRAIQATTQLYKAFLKWISKAKIDDLVESTWEEWKEIKQFICSMLDTSDNEGVKTQCIKFMESVVVVETKKDQWSSTVSNDDFNLENLEQCPLVDANQLEEEAKGVFEQLIVFHGTPHISSVNLMATMQSLVLIARHRSSLFMSKVITALEALHANLPPTLAKSQVSSVRKYLKLQLMMLLKHPAAALSRTYQLQIVQLATDLGASQSEINKCLQEVRKRGHKVEVAHVEPKRIKLDNEDEPKSQDVVLNIPKITRNEANTAIDVTTDDLVAQLKNQTKVVDLVLYALMSLPETLPVHFGATYTPVAAAGTDSQIKHLARLIATQLTAHGLGKGVTDMVARVSADAGSSSRAGGNEEQHQKIAAIIGRGIAQVVTQDVRKQEQHQAKAAAAAAAVATPTKVKLVPTGKANMSATVRFKQLNLADITGELNESSRLNIAQEAVQRILQIDNSRLFLSTEQMNARTKILSHLCTEYGGSNLNVREIVKRSIFEDLRNRYELMLSILYNEYLNSKVVDDACQGYNECLLSFLRGILAVETRDRDHFLPKFLNEVTLITREALTAVKDFIASERSQSAISLGFSILTDLLKARRLLRDDVMAIILELTIHMDNVEARQQAVKTIRTLHKVPEYRETIESYALSIFRLLLAQPPSSLNTATWNEEMIKIYQLPYLCLLPGNHSLVHNLSVVYVDAPPDIKRIILRALELPVKGMGMNSPELLTLVENCPKGAETLVARIIHLLTDKQAPSVALVSRVRDLYQKRVPDVRFLIPVLNGLTKKEVIGVLPKLIKLNPIVVKDVVNRLLGANVSDSSSSSFQSPLTPTELLTALHNIKNPECDIKPIIKDVEDRLLERGLVATVTVGSKKS